MEAILTDDFPTVENMDYNKCFFSVTRHDVSDCLDVGAVWFVNTEWRAGGWLIR